MYIFRKFKQEIKTNIYLFIIKNAGIYWSGRGISWGGDQLDGVGLVMSPTPYLSPTFNRNNKSPPFDRCTDTVTHAKRAEEKKS